MNIIYKKVGEITPYEKNPRKNDNAVQYVAESIKQFGFKVPIIIDKNGVIVAGHTRLKAAIKLGLEEVPCIVADDLNEKQIAAFRLADNRVGEISTWDFDLLDEQLADLKFDFDFEALGFKDLLQEEEEIDVHEDDFDVDKFVPENAISKLGDIYKLGKHTLMCGDALNKNNVNSLINEEQIELMFTDPPYELETKGGGILKNAKSMQEIETNKVNHFNPLLLNPFCTTNIFFHNKALIKDYIELSEKYNLSYDLAIYKKNNVAPNYNSHLMTDIEYIAIIGNLDPNKGFDKEMYSKCWSGSKDEENELSYSKPVELCSKFIQLYSKEKVLDLFGGSGSTMIACEQLGRTCYMMELDPKYCDVIVKRYIRYMGSAENCTLNDGPIPSELKEGIL